MTAQQHGSSNLPVRSFWFIANYSRIHKCNCIIFEKIPILHCTTLKFRPFHAINFLSSYSKIDETAVVDEKADEFNNELVHLNSVIHHDYDKGFWNILQSELEVCFLCQKFFKKNISSKALSSTTFFELTHSYISRVLKCFVWTEIFPS